MSIPFAIVGEAIVDILIGPDGTGRAVPGGSPANVAVGLARLGQPVTLFTQVGEDEHGELLRRHLRDNGVTIEQSGRVRATSVARTRVDDAGQAHYDFAVEWSVPELPVPAKAACVHIGSLGAFLEPGATAVRSLLDCVPGDRVISFDPNCRPALLGSASSARQVTERFVASAHIVRASDEDLAWLYPGLDHEQVASAWLAAGPSLVVVTRGAEGAYAVTRGGVVAVPAPRVDVVDTVGAGDSFTAALLDGLGRSELLSPDRLRNVDTATLTSILTRSAAAAALTCTRPGADPPRLSELAECLPADATASDPEQSR